MIRARSICLRTTAAGQPLFHSHPHLIEQSTHLTPFIDASEYKERRNQLAAKMTGGVAIIPGYGLRYSTNAGIFYRFHQNNDFSYFTGLLEADAAMVLDKSGKFTLFLKPEDAHSKVWDGARTGLEDAKRLFGADEARPISEFSAFIKTLDGKVYSDLDIEKGIEEQSHLKLASNSHAASSPDKDQSISSFIMNSFRSKKSDIPARVEKSPLIPLMHPMRLIKSESEIECMKKACEITSEAFKDMIKYVKPGMGEHEIQAYLEFKCKVRGADTMAYVPVVAGGANALVIHYVVNNAIVNDGELILCDAGAEFGGYCADITRTFPVNGKFSPAQREIYSAVLEANTLAVSRCRAGGMSLDAIHNESVQNLYEAVCDIFERQITLKEMQSFYPHHIAHYLGLDVHDTFSISRDIPLKAGMVVTMEPGLYIPNDKEKYGEYAGIGVRIEDDILITEGEPIVLSAGSPKEINEIEELYPPNE